MVLFYTCRVSEGRGGVINGSVGHSGFTSKMGRLSNKRVIICGSFLRLLFCTLIVAIATNLICLRGRLSNAVLVLTVKMVVVCLNRVGER